MTATILALDVRVQEPAASMSPRAEATRDRVRTSHKAQTGLTSHPLHLHLLPALLTAQTFRCSLDLVLEATARYPGRLSVALLEFLTPQTLTLSTMCHQPTPILSSINRIFLTTLPMALLRNSKIPPTFKTCLSPIVVSTPSSIIFMHRTRLCYQNLTCLLLAANFPWSHCWQQPAG